MSEGIAPTPFYILKCCGSWRPLGWSGWKRVAYSTYSALMLIVLLTTMSAVFINVCRMPITEDVFAENVFLMFALINAIFKAVNLLISRGRFIRMLNMIQSQRWKELRNDREIELRNKYSETIRKISLYFTSAVFVSIILRLIVPLFDLDGEPKLPVDSFCPCNIREPGCYWPVYLHQAIGTGTATLTHAAKDSLISALLLQTCFQLEVLKVRLLDVPRACSQRDRVRRDEGGGDLNPRECLEGSLLKDCIRDHESIFHFAAVLNESLNVLLFGQLAITLPNLCLSIYRMSKQNIGSVDFLMTTQFFLAVVIELFFFCWYGNQVTLNSIDVGDTVSDMDWTSLSLKYRKDLMIIMMRSSRPILFSVGPIMNMNIDSFLKIMKTSYSAFSVLQSTDS